MGGGGGANEGKVKWEVVSRASPIPFCSADRFQYRHAQQRKESEAREGKEKEQYKLQSVC